jgi:hypothetical protein
MAFQSFKTVKIPILFHLENSLLCCKHEINLVLLRQHSLSCLLDFNNQPSAIPETEVHFPVKLCTLCKFIIFCRVGWGELVVMEFGYRIGEFSSCDNIMIVKIQYHNHPIYRPRHLENSRKRGSLKRN